MESQVERVKKLHREAEILHLSSSGGAEYASTTAIESSISDFFVGFFAKAQLHY